MPKRKPGELELFERAAELSKRRTRLRRQIGLLQGVAANLVGLIYIAIAQGRCEDALALVDEATEIARTAGAHRVLGQIEEAREQIKGTDRST